MLHRIRDAHLLPSTVEYARQILKDVHLPIGICNGQEYLDEDGEWLGELFKKADLQYDELDNLFEEKKIYPNMQHWLLEQPLFHQN